MGKPAARITDFHMCPMVTPGVIVFKNFQLMLVIGTKQMQELRKFRVNDFHQRMVEFISHNFRLNKNNSILGEVSEAITEAQNFGFDYETDIEDYLFIKWKYSEMKEKPLPQHILNIVEFPNRKSERKISMLLSILEKYKNAAKDNHKNLKVWIG